MNYKKLKVYCKECGKELEAEAKIQTCGCPNMTTLSTDKITANDLSKVVIVEGLTTKNEIYKISKEDLAFQEARSKRKVRKLNYEVR
jgi:hypothetical protein